MEQQVTRKVVQKGVNRPLQQMPLQVLPIEVVRNESERFNAADTDCTSYHVMVVFVFGPLENEIGKGNEKGSWDCSKQPFGVCHLRML